MKIAIDARIIRPHFSGLGRYAYSLIKTLSEIDNENEYIIIKSDQLDQQLVEADNFTEIPMKGTPEDVGSFFGRIHILDGKKVDIFHSLYHFLPGYVDAKKQIITLHDLIWITHPELAFSNKLQAFIVNKWASLFIKRTYKKSNAVICISEATRREAIKNFREKKIMPVIYHGEKILWHSNSDSGQFLSSDKLPSNYFLLLGHTKPYKNAEGAIRGLAKAVKECPDLKLLIVGRGDEYKNLTSLVTALNISEHIQFLPQVSEKDLAMLYKNARALLQPSFIEGFGMPVVEAMAHGCPSITSDRASLPEISGTAGIQIDPYNIDQISDAMVKMHTDIDFRNYVVKECSKQVNLFNWKIAAEKTIEVYRQVNSMGLRH